MRLLLLAFSLFLIAPMALLAQSGIEVSCTTPDETACIDWNKGVAYAVGIGAPPAGAGAASNPMARRASKAIGENRGLQHKPNGRNAARQDMPL